MNFLSSNIKGIRVAGKPSWVKGLIVKFGVDFLVIQETMISRDGSFDFHRVWGRNDLDFDMVEASGRSGGLANLWNPKKFSKTSDLKDRNFLVTSGFLVEDGTFINVVNIYAPQKTVQKRDLWDRLRGVINEKPGLWILLGDFNAVRFPEERRNSNFNNLSASDFNRFIDDANLQEYQMRGNKFTFLAGKDKGFKMSKIDRILVCQDFFNRWPLACLRALPRGFSDHCPLLLSLTDSNFGTKPFRWFNSWLDIEGCVEAVLKAFDDFSFEGPADVVITKQLNAVRSVLKVWWKSYLEKEDESSISLKFDIERLEKIMEDRDLEEEELWVWEESKKDLD